MFDTLPKDLRDLLRDAHTGSLQLPDFQRSYVWDDEDVQNLIASVAKGYPIGAFLSLETGGEVNFKPRLLEGIAEKPGVSPSDLLLDGQQRLTSLYQAIYSKDPVRTRNSREMEVDRFYYLDIPEALRVGADIKDAIIGVPADRIRRTNFGRDVAVDLSTRNKEFDKHAYPLNQVFDEQEDWFYDWRNYWKERGKDVSDWRWDFGREVITPITTYKIPVIKLHKKNSREAICLIFEKVNKGGQPLDTFELLTAMYSARVFRSSPGLEWAD